jgi:peptide chain release factor 1
MQVLKARVYDKMRREADAAMSDRRKNQVGSGDRSERIRTYNCPQGRVTDHRICMTLYSIDTFMNGDIEEMIEALRIADQTAKLNDGGGII